MGKPQVLRFIFSIIVFTEFLPNLTHSMMLKFLFKKVADNSMQLLSYSYKTERAGTPEECATICLGDTGDLYCYAFSYRPEEMSCSFYVFGSVHIAPPGDDLYLLQGQSVFHPISIETRLYSIYLSLDKKNYTGARAHCESMGSYLLHFDSSDEYKVVTMLREMFNVVGQIFIGADDMESEGHWVSDRDGAEIDPSVWIWGENQPDNWYGEHCASIDQRNFINDVHCYFLLPYICERDV